MKKFVLILLFIATLLYAQETVIVGDFNLNIPTDYYDLKNAYIIMANLYIESDSELTKSIENFKTLKIEYDKTVAISKDQEKDIETLNSLITNKLNPSIKNSEDQINILTNELEKWIKPDLFQLYGGVSFLNNIQIPDFYLGVYLNLLIYEQFSIKAEYLLGNKYSVGVGYKIF